MLDRDVRNVVLKLERMGKKIQRRFKRDHGHVSCFQNWDAMPEPLGELTLRIKRKVLYVALKTAVRQEKAKT
jgi:hypothetical protein